jgi:hypothetical protein
VPVNTKPKRHTISNLANTIASVRFIHWLD